MRVIENLIVGLGSKLMATETNKQLAILNTPAAYAAVCIYSNDIESHNSKTFLGQSHCLNIPKHHLHSLLPFLNEPTLDEQETPFAQAHTSRRYARFLFSQLAHEAWATIDQSLNHTDTAPKKIIVLVDMADAFANAIWIDCLFEFKQRWPLAEVYPVFLLPNAKNADKQAAATIGAAMLELDQISQGIWVPNDLEHGQSYQVDQSLWTAAYLQEYSKSHYSQMVDAVLHLANSKPANDSALPEQLSNEQQLIFNPRTKKDKKPLPRFASIIRSSLQFDQQALKKLLAKRIHSDFLQRIVQVQATATTLSIADLEAMGCTFNPETLYWQQNTVLAAQDLDINTYWQQQSQYCGQESPNPALNWVEQISANTHHLRGLYQRDFCDQGTNACFDCDDQKILDLVTTQTKHIEQQLWNKWQQGQMGLVNCQTAIETLVIHTVKQHQHCIQQNDELGLTIKQHISDYTHSQQQWRQGNEADQVHIENTTPVSLMAQTSAAIFAMQCHIQSSGFVKKYLLLLQEQLLQLQLQFVTALVHCRQQIQQLETQLQDQFAAHTQTWFTQDTSTMHIQCILQPNAASVNRVRSDTQANIQIEYKNWLQNELGQLGMQADFSGLLTMLGSQGGWQQRLSSVANQLGQSSVVNDKVTMQSLIKNRVLDLDATQIQTLSQIMLDNTNKKMQNIIQPLGQVLTAKHKTDTHTNVVCDPQITDHAMVESLLALCDDNDATSGLITPIAQTWGTHILHTQTAYLSEWRDFNVFAKSYQQFKHSEESMLHLHIDGNPADILDMQSQSKIRNRDLIRQHLLLAYALGQLVQDDKTYHLDMPKQDNGIQFKNLKMTGLVEQISLVDANNLVEEHQKMANGDVTQLNSGLHEALTQIQQETLKPGVDLAEMDWHDAGKYVAWQRAARNLRKEWIRPNRLY